jgi:hypothetical protein
MNRSRLTPAGFAMIVIALFILIRSLSARNAYEILLSSVMTLLWVLLGAAGLWGKRKLAALEPKWKPPFPFTANSREESLVTELGFPSPWFFRLHVVLRGRFFPSGSGGGCPVFAEAAVPIGSVSANLSFSLPMSGTFRGAVSCRLRDIFGFFSFRCGIAQQRTVNVMPSPSLKKQLRIAPQSGAEDRRSKSTDDEERYYMREYSPGDRLRDINWKSSERIDTLITRISPDTHEKICRIEVYFRNYSRNYGTAVSLDELWLLDRAKARLSHFLRLVKESDDAYVFLVHTAQGSWELNDREALEAFLETLAGFPFSPPAREYPEASDSGELYVFSTACDEDLQSFLFACGSRPVSLFVVQPALPNTKPEETETLLVSDFPASGCFPSPKWLFGKLFFSRNRRRMTLPAGRVEKDYAELRLWKK